MNKYAKFAALIAVVVGTLIWLGTAGSTESETYYKTVKELNGMSGKSKTSKIRVGGDVASGSIVRKADIVEFTLQQENATLRVAYDGKDPLPDTFKDGAQALADGRLGPDGVFHASEIQAKCASKYAPKPGMAPDQLQPGAKPAVINSPMRSSL